MKLPQISNNHKIEVLFGELYELEEQYQQYSQEQDWYDPEEETDMYFSYQEKLDDIKTKIFYINEEIHKLKS